MSYVQHTCAYRNSQSRHSTITTTTILPQVVAQGRDFVASAKAASIIDQARGLWVQSLRLNLELATHQDYRTYKETDLVATTETLIQLLRDKGYGKAADSIEDRYRVAMKYILAGFREVKKLKKPTDDMVAAMIAAGYNNAPEHLTDGFVQASSYITGASRNSTIH